MNLQGTLKRKTKQKGLTREELNNFSKEELIDRILQLEAHTVQLKNIINRNQIEKASASSASKKAFDFSKCGKRHVLLKLYYLGWDYNGFAVQEDTTETIEHYLFAALTKSCLIESRQTSNYHRCGRTDKGVSSFGQVISLDIRSRFSQVELDLNPNITEGELQYPKTLNRLLPDNIRILAWCPVPADYSARFSCKERTYKYFFPRGDLDIKVMNSAAQLLVGKHDFRNLCKMDVGNGVTAFDRVINSVEICVPGEDQDNPSGYDMCTLTLKGESFLWHQVRCIMGILFLIGQRKEKPDVITKLLNISEYRRKPQYNMGSEVPLNLFHCSFELADWIVDMEDLRAVVIHLQKIWSFLEIKSTMVRSMLNECESTLRENVPREQSSCLIQGCKPKTYVPLLERPLCESLEERVEHYMKRRRLKVENDADIDSASENDKQH